MSRRAAWLLVLVVGIVAAGQVAYRDVPPGLRTALGFTLFAVDAGGTRETVAQFDGRRWRPPCEAVGPPRVRARPVRQPIVAIEATRNTPLFPVQELGSTAVHWNAAWRTLAADAAPDVDETWAHDAHVYAVQDRAPLAAFVDVTLRPSAVAWRGVSISGWVALLPYGARRLDADVRRFASYDEYMALDRPMPLGVVQNTVTGASVWVMRTTGLAEEEIRIVELGDRATELMRVPRTAGEGC